MNTDFSLARRDNVAGTTSPGQRRRRLRAAKPLSSSIVFNYVDYTPKIVLHKPVANTRVSHQTASRNLMRTPRRYYAE